MKITPNKNQKSGRSIKRTNKYSDEDENYLDLLKLKDEKIDWHCVCVTLDDWYEFTSKYKKSRKKQDQELYRVLEENYLKEMPDLFNKAVRASIIFFLKNIF